eukprot:m.72258 g.72258  ORF g.72258 m.72258 type:complete len:131 (+) comp8375_c0_seq2:3-395(+)
MDGWTDGYVSQMHFAQAYNPSLLPHNFAMNKVSEAASILLKSGLIYRLIDMFIRLYQWDKALDTAIQHKTHVDTVIGRRQRYLESIGQTESKDKFLSYAQSIEINWDDINAKIETELENEKQRPGAKPFS